MRILIATGIFPPDIGGPATYTKLLLEKLPAQGFLVRLITYGEKQEGDPINITKISRIWPKGFRHLLYFLKVLRWGFFSDVIFAQDAVSAGLPAMLAAKLLRKKLLLKIVGDYAWEQGVQRFRVHDSIDDFQTKKYDFRVRALKKLQVLVVKSADAIITPSEYLKDIVVGWGASKNSIRVIYNAVSIPPVDFSKEEAKKQLGIQGALIVSAGRLVPWKGFEVLIRAMPVFLAKTQNLKLFIIGDGPEREKLEQLVRDFDLKKKVFLIGALSRDQLMLYLKAADIFVLNTGYEGFSHQVIEAMGLGVPIATTDAGGNKEIIINGKDGFLFKFNDLEDMILKVGELLKNKNFQRKFSEEGIKKAKQFSKERMISEVINLLNSLQS